LGLPVAFVRGALVTAKGARLAIATRGTRSSVLPILPVLAVATFGALVGSLLFAGLDHLVLTLVLVGVIVTLAALILEAGAAFAQHPEIMVRILQIIFGLDAITRELRVARHALVFFEQLRSVAALAIVLPVSRLSTEALAPLAPTAAPAAALTIIDQIRLP
jgi:hypothetical protein